ncbi:MAG: hypothetical protein JWQ98_3022 [Chlorobi bacterium]|nr:hypothetical protein [Chlorobiota bacterium]
MERIRTVRVLSIFSLAFLFLAVGCKKKPDADHPAGDSVKAKAEAPLTTALPNTWKWVNGQIKYTVLPSNSGGTGVAERGNWASMVTIAGSATDTIENCHMGGVKDIPMPAGIYMITPKFHNGSCPAIPDSLFTGPTSVDTVSGHYILKFRSADTNNVSIDISLIDIIPTTEHP